MKLIIDRFTLVIEPENDQDIAYIEDTLGLLKNGDSLRLVRCRDGDFDIALETDTTEYKAAHAVDDIDEVTDPEGVVPAEDTGIQVTRPDIASQFKDICEGNKLEKTISRNGGETLVDIQAIDI